MVGFDSSAGKKYKYDGEVTAEKLVKFAEDVIAGKAAKFFKSGERTPPPHAATHRPSISPWHAAPCLPALPSCCWPALVRPAACPSFCIPFFLPALPCRCPLMLTDVPAAPAAPPPPPAAAEPAEPLDKGVAVIVGNNVESVVMDPTKVRGGRAGGEGRGRRASVCAQAGLPACLPPRCCIRGVVATAAGRAMR